MSIKKSEEKTARTDKAMFHRKSCQLPNYLPDLRDDQHRPTMHREVKQNAKVIADGVCSKVDDHGQ